MGGADGNVEEEIGSLEKKIRIVEESIQGLDAKIEGVEELIIRCPNKERELLLHEKAQLRDEKALLLHKEAQLRDEKAQLRETFLDKHTEYNWLCQDLPSWDSGCSSRTPSTTQKERIYTPFKVEYWDTKEDIKVYLDNADRGRRRYQNVEILTATTGRQNVADVAGSIVASACDFLSTKESGSSVMYAREARLEVPPNPLAQEGKAKNPDESKFVDKDVLKSLYYAKPPRVDILLKSNDENVAVFELKNGGLGCPLPIHKLWTRCSCRTEIDPNCWCNAGISKGQARSLLNCILQVYEYLVLAKVGYGVLTDIQNWYLFKRDQTGCLYISVGFKWNNREPHLLAVIAYLINTSINAGGELDVLPKQGERPWNWDVTPCTSPSSGSEDDDDKDPPYEPSEDETGDCERTRDSSSNRRQNQLQEIPASDLHLNDRPITSVGWSGCVVGGHLNGRPVAVKFALHKTERAEALMNEVGAYLKLQEHWGVFVPPLIGYGTTADGRVVYIATELIDGSQLGPGTVTREVATAALQALGAVHACGLLHGDVEARNVMVVRGIQPSVRLVDFGFAQRSSNRKWQKAELMKLQRLLEDMMGVGVGKESDGIR